MYSWFGGNKLHGLEMFENRSSERNFDMNSSIMHIQSFPQFRFYADADTNRDITMIRIWYQCGRDRGCPEENV